MKALIMLVIGGGNPANLLASMQEAFVAGDRRIGGRFGDDEKAAAPLAAEVSKGRLQVAAALLRHIKSIWDRFPTQEEEWGIEERRALVLLRAWAVTEEVNDLVGDGSHQRAKCPIEGISGSGRWGARDRGGCYRLLREAVIERDRLSTPQEGALERAFEALSRWTLERVVDIALQRRLKKNPGRRRHARTSVC